MVKIRLFRTGTRKRPHYRIVAIESRNKRQGRFLENLGTYHPSSGGAVEIREEALQRWLDQGAQASETVRSLVRRAKRVQAAETGADPAGEQEGAPPPS
jgi:small subunit ribosomal protein S16